MLVYSYSLNWSWLLVLNIVLSYVKKVIYVEKRVCTFLCGVLNIYFNVYVQFCLYLTYINNKTYSYKYNNPYGVELQRVTIFGFLV